MRRFYFGCLFLFFHLTVDAQNLLSLESVITQTLQHNFQLKMAKNEQQIAGNNNHAGASGMLPSLSLNINENPSLTSINQQFANGTSIQREGVTGNNLNGNLLLTYTLFDGRKMFAYKEKLEIQEAVATLKLNIQMQQVLAKVIVQYSQIGRLQQQEKVYLQLVQFSKDRMELMEVREKNGMANRADILQSAIDLSAQEQNLKAIQLQLIQEKILLHSLIGISSVTGYLVEELKVLINEPDRNFYETSFKENAELKSALMLENIALEEKKMADAALYPQLRLNAQYGYSRAQNSAGFSLYNQNAGPSALLNLQIPLFNGNNTKVARKNASLQIQAAKDNRTSVELNLQNEFEKSWQLYYSYRELIKQDESQTPQTEEWFELVKKRFELNQTNLLELREAERIYENFQLRKVNNLHQAKVAETELLKLCNQLIK